MFSYCSMECVLFNIKHTLFSVQLNIAANMLHNGQWDECLLITEFIKNPKQ